LVPGNNRIRLEADMDAEGLSNIDNLTIIGAGLAATPCDMANDTDINPADYYVAPDGDDDNPGNIDEPFATMAHAQSVAEAGDTVYFRNGECTYDSSTDAVGVLLDKNGLPGYPIHYVAYPGEQPIFDFFGMSASERLYGIRVTADWIHIRGLELRLEFRHFFVTRRRSALPAAI
jgi:hypothetical protein